MSNLPDGVFVATLTPLNADLSVDHAALYDHCRWLLAGGADGVALLGTTGEANSFSLAERLEVIEKLLSAGFPGDRLMAGTGCCALPDTVDLTRAAVSGGAGGVLLLPPFYYKAVSDDGLFRYMEQLITSMADDRLKIYLYHFPKMTGVPFSNALVKRLVKAFPEAVVGMKDSSGDPAHMQAVCRELPGFRLYAGAERYLLDVLEAGGAGCITATTNATAPLAAAVYRAWREGRPASALQEKLTGARLAFERGSFVPILKQFFARRTGNDQWLYLRPPNALLPEERINELWDALPEEVKKK